MNWGQILTAKTRHGR